MAIEEISNTSNLELRLPTRRAHRADERDFSSRTGMRKLRNLVPGYFRLMNRLIGPVVLENRQILHAHREDEEPGRDEAERDHELGPLRDEMMPGPSLKAGDADVEAIGHESE